MTDQLPDDVVEQAGELDAFIAGVDPVDEPIVLWRLLDSRLVYVHGTRLVGTELTDLGYVDATTEEGVARDYAGGERPVLARILAPAGTRIGPLFAVIESDEGDVLLARGTRFRVLAFRPAGGPDGRGLPEIDLELVP